MRPFLFVSLYAVFSITVARAEEVAPTGTIALAKLGWLAGAWQTTAHGRTTTEIWMPPDGATMLGASRTVARGVTVEYEFLLLREERDGAISYVARPSGQAEATFTLVAVSDDEVTFENPAHDFPQRVIYRRHGEDELIAAVEGTSKGKFRRLEFHYRRIDLSAPAPAAAATAGHELPSLAEPGRAQSPSAPCGPSCARGGV